MDIRINDIYPFDSMPRQKVNSRLKLRQRLVGKVVGIRASRRRPRKSSKTSFFEVAPGSDPDGTKTMIIVFPDDFVFDKKVKSGQKVKIEFDSDV